jgi:hypothetical protein
MHKVIATRPGEPQLIVELTQEELLAVEQKEIEYQNYIKSPEYKYAQFQIVNKVILDQLTEIDLKSIRALRASDTERLQQLEAEAVLLRAQLQVIE